MKHTLLWIFLCIFFGIAAFEAAMIIGLTAQNHTDQRLLKLEDRQRILHGEIVAIRGPAPKGKKAPHQGEKINVPVQ